MSYTVAGDVDGLVKAMKGLGTDEDALIKILCNRPREHLLAVRKAYREMKGKDLVEKIKDETTGHFEKVLVNLLQPRAYLMCHMVRGAIKGLGTNDEILSEVMCNADAHDIKEMSDLYPTLFEGKSLATDIKDDTSGDYQRLLLKIATGGRAPEGPADQASAAHDAERLYKAGEGRVGTDEAVITEILTTRSHAQLSAIAAAYANKYGKSLDAAMSSETSGNFKRCLKALTSQPGEFIAKKVRDCCVGAGTDDANLIRIITYCRPEQLKQANQWHLSAHKKTMAQLIKEDTSGDYRNALLALIPPV